MPGPEDTAAASQNEYPMSPQAGLARRMGRAGAYELELARRGILLRFIRIAFVILVLVIALLNVIEIPNQQDPGAVDFTLGTLWWATVTTAALLAAAFLAVDLLTPRKRIAAFSGVLFGLLAGLIGAWALGTVLDLVIESWDFPSDSKVIPTVKVLLGVCLGYLGISTVLQTQDDFRLVIPYVEFSKQFRGQRPLLLDTSALIDARIVEVGEAGLMQTPIIVPAFVIEELQRLSDSGDKLKRARGRRGLDVVGRLQRSGRLDVSIDETMVPGKAVDQMLVELARRETGMVVTTDAGLARVARIQDVPVLNLNELANALKPIVIPGQTLRVQIIKPGEQAGQGVGFLDDGTMVVVEDGGERINETVDATVTSSVQTAAGRLIFARIDGRVDGRVDGRGDGRGDGRAPVAPNPAGTHDTPPEPDTDDAADPPGADDETPQPARPARRRGQNPTSRRNPRR
ncbi:MAG: TRAM domain-containing protein [Planctomycetota bacterium]